MCEHPHCQGQHYLKWWAFGNDIAIESQGFAIARAKSASTVTTGMEPLNTCPPSQDGNGRGRRFFFPSLLFLGTLNKWQIRQRGGFSNSASLARLQESSFFPPDANPFAPRIAHSFGLVNLLTIVESIDC